MPNRVCRTWRAFRVDGRVAGRRGECSAGDIRFQSLAVARYHAYRSSSRDSYHDCSPRWSCVEPRRLPSPAVGDFTGGRLRVGI